MSDSNSRYAKDRAAANSHKAVAIAAMPLLKLTRQKLTEERIADLQQLHDVSKRLFRNGCLVYSFHSSDEQPVLMVEPNATFKRLIVGKCVHIDDRNKQGKVVQVLNHVVMGGVKVSWVELEIKKEVLRTRSSK